MLQATNDGVNALEHYKQAFAINETLLKEDSTNTFYQRAIGIDYQLLSLAYLDAGNLEQAREYQTKNIAMWERMTQADPKNVVAQSDLGLGCSRMVAVLAKSGDAAGAREYYQRAMTILTGLLVKDPSNVTYLMVLRGNYMRMTDLLLSTGDVGGAVEDARRELAIDDQILATNPASADAPRNQAMAHAQLGKAFALAASNPHGTPTEQEQNWKAARSEYQTSVDVWQNTERKGPAVLDVAKREEVIRELANCDAELGAIQRKKTVR